MREDTGLESYFQITQKLGEGSFGEVYQAIWQGEDVAMKVERRTTRCPQLLNEYKLLTKMQAGVGIPQVYSVESVAEWNVLVMELLGPTVHDVFIACGKKFDPGLVMQLGEQMVARLEFVHSRGVVHRDMKPDNFLLGRGIHANLVYLIDFGISQYFRDSKSLKHCPLTTGHALRGTAKYCSLNTHHGLDQSRRDDLESLGYVLVYLAQGSLPWDNFRSPLKQERHHGIGAIKQNTTLAALCQNAPSELEAYLNYCKALLFETRPDYKHLKRLFREGAQRLQPSWDLISLKLPEAWTNQTNTSEQIPDDHTESNV
jgi:casein kinase 1